MERLQRVRCQLLMRKPWYGTFAAMMKWREVPAKTCPTMGVAVLSEGTVDAVYCKEFTEKLSDEALACVIIHEIDHVIRMHCIRRLSRMKEVWNVAADAIVNGRENNPNIKVTDKHFAEKCFLSHDCVWYAMEKDNETTESYYDWLKKNATTCPTCGVTIIHNKGQGQGGQGQGQGKEEQEKGQQGKGQGQQGKGQGQQEKEEGGGCPTCGAKPQMVDNHDWWDNSTGNEDNARAIIDGMAEQATQTVGNAPGHLTEALKGLKETKHNWSRELDEWMGKACGGKRPTFARPNRRIPKFGIPGNTCRAMADVSVFVDTSGSMGAEELKEAFGHIDKIAYRSKITLIEFDHGIEHVGKYRKGDWRKIKIHGRGGTSVVAALNQAEERNLIGDANVVITDGYLEWPEQKPYPVLWYIVSSSKEVPKWGKVIKP